MDVTDRLPDSLPFVGAPEPDLRPFLRRAAAWASDLTYREIPKPVRRAAKAQLTSTVGAAVWTRSHPIGVRIIDATETAYSGGDATFLGGRTLSPEGAACGNATLSSALSFADSVFGVPTSHSSVFVPLAYAESEGVDGRRVVVAHVAANEVAARLGAAVALGSEEPTPAVHAVAAAVGRGVIEGVEPETLTDGLGIALQQPPRPLTPALVGSNGTVTRANESIRTGIAALDAARGGLSGRPDLVEADYGLLSELTSCPIPAFLDDLGERWFTRALAVKPVPVDEHVIGAVEAVLEVRGRFDYGRTAIGRIDVYGSQFLSRSETLAAENVSLADSPVGAVSRSVSLNVAVALADGRLTPEGTASRVDTPEIRALADRVELHHDPEMTKTALDAAATTDTMYRYAGRSALSRAAGTLGFPATLRNLPTLLRKRSIPADVSTLDSPPGARVEVATSDGRTLESTVDHPSAALGAPLAESRAVARKKCRSGLETLGVSESTARSRVDALLAIDEGEIPLAGLLDTKID